MKKKEQMTRENIGDALSRYNLVSSIFQIAACIELFKKITCKSIHIFKKKCRVDRNRNVSREPQPASAVIQYVIPRFLDFGLHVLEFGK